MADIVKKLMKKLSIDIDDDKKLSSDEIMELENTYGAHKYFNPINSINCFLVIIL